MNLQTINAAENLVFSPSIYGDDNGNTVRFISGKLETLAPGYGSTHEMYKAMRDNSKKIGAMDNAALDQINFWLF